MCQRFGYREKLTRYVPIAFLQRVKVVEKLDRRKLEYPKEVGLLEDFVRQLNFQYIQKITLLTLDRTETGHTLDISKIGRFQSATMLRSAS